jgi:hypothetical protein
MGELSRRRSKAHRRFTTATWCAVPAALALAVVVVALRPTPEEGDRSKGDPASLLVYRSTGRGSEPLSDEDVARAGDVVRIGYRSSERVFGAIVSIDGRGVMTRHLPADGTRALPLEPGRVVLLDDAFELDDAPAVERFYLITAPTSFDVAPVFDAVRRTVPGKGNGLTRPDVPRSMNVVTFSLRKDTKQ